MNENSEGIKPEPHNLIFKFPFIINNPFNKKNDLILFPKYETKLNRQL